MIMVWDHDGTTIIMELWVEKNAWIGVERDTALAWDCTYV